MDKKITVQLDKDGFPVDSLDPRMKLRPNQNDKLNDLRLLRDLSLANERTLRELGALPAGGLPVPPKRKPNLPRYAPPAPVTPASITPTSATHETDMFKLGNLFKRKPRDPWPLWFSNYSFDARCYNTLRCSSIFYRAEHSLHLVKPSGQPYAPDWKYDWSAGYSTGENFERHGFPSPVYLRWTALDGSQHEDEIDLEKVFPDHLILHNVSREEVDEDWARHGSFGKGHNIEILLEVNDRTVNIYMKAAVYSKPKPSSPDRRGYHNDLMLAWTKTY